jgi:hypothetical protein
MSDWKSSTCSGFIASLTRKAPQRERFNAIQLCLMSGVGPEDARASMRPGGRWVVKANPTSAPAPSVIASVSIVSVVVFPIGRTIAVVPVKRVHHASGQEQHRSKGDNGQVSHRVLQVVCSTCGFGCQVTGLGFCCVKTPCADCPRQAPPKGTTNADTQMGEGTMSTLPPGGWPKGGKGDEGGNHDVSTPNRADAVFQFSNS